MKALGCASLVSVILSSVLGCTGAINAGPSSQGTGMSGQGGNAGATPTGGMTDGGSGASGAAGAGGGPPTCSSLPPVPRRLWRLAVEQYQNAVKDVLGLSVLPLLSNRGGQAQYAFFSDISLGIDEKFQFALYEAVESALPLVAPPITACNTGETPNSCATRVAQTLGAKAFRRPLTTVEVNDLVSRPAEPATATTPALSAAPFLQGQGTSTAVDSNTQVGIKLMIEAILLSPSFVYRTELGPSTLIADASGKYPDTTLTPNEVATQLAFTFLGTVPDPALLAAAADTSATGLGTVAGITTQIDRLLALPAVKQNLTEIIAGWFNMQQLFGKVHDPSLLAALPPEDLADPLQTAVKNDIYTSVQQFITDTLWTHPGKIPDLLLSQKVFVNSRLAALYPELAYAGARPTSPTTFVAATWPASEGRIGLLSYPSYLWAQSDPALTSIVKRGKAIHDDVICANPLPPPIDLSQPEAAKIVATGDSEVTKSDARLAALLCVGCHRQMDPYSRILQNFGPIGNYRTTDEMGRPIDSTVMFTGGPLSGQTFTGPTAFGTSLVATGTVSGCAVQKMASYVIGSMITTYDTCEVENIRKEFNQSDGTISSLFRQVVLADFARARTGGTK